ncbi:tetratricopeptide repeat protein [bacterium]|nr:tetratricopeptide repeat protein [bacterium]
MKQSKTSNRVIPDLARFVVLFLPAFLGFLLVGCSGSSDLNRYDFMIANGQIETVIENYREILSEDAENVEIRYRLANALFINKELEQARVEIEKTILLEKQIDKYRLLAGKIAYQRKFFFDATNHLINALLLNNRNIEAYYYLALTYRETGKATDALKQLETAIGIEPMNFDAQLLWCEISFDTLTAASAASASGEKAGKQSNRESFLDLAERLKKALLVNPNSVEGNILLAGIYQAIGETQYAKALLVDFENRNATNDMIAFEIAAINYSMGSFQGTLEYLDKMTHPTLESKILRLKTLIKIDPLGDYQADLKELQKEGPDKPEILLIQGKLDYQKGELTRAEQSLQHAINIDPRFSDGYYMLSKVFGAQKDLFGAEWALSRAFEISPFNKEIRIDYIRQRIEAGDFQTAESALQHPSLNEMDSNAVFLRGLIAKQKKDYETAEKLFNYVKQFDYSVDVEAQLASIDIARNRIAAAESRLNHIESIYPGTLAVSLQRAAILEKLGKIDEIPSQLKNHLTDLEGRGKVHLLMAEAYGKQENLEAAINLLSKGLERWPRQLELVQAYSFYLGLAGKYDRAIEVLEDIQSFNHTFKLMFFYRLKSFYFQSGKMEKYKQYSDPFQPIY